MKSSLEKGPEAWELDERFPTNSGALSDTRSVSDEGLPKRRRLLAASDKIEFAESFFWP